jgi:hypothetical protein
MFTRVAASCALDGNKRGRPSESVCVSGCAMALAGLLRLLGAGPTIA